MSVENLLYGDEMKVKNERCHVLIPLVMKFGTWKPRTKCTTNEKVSENNKKFTKKTFWSKIKKLKQTNHKEERNNQPCCSVVEHCAQ